MSQTHLQGAQGETQDLKKQLVSFLEKQTDSAMEPQRESFVRFIRSSIKDMDADVYFDLEFEMYQLLHRFQKRDKEVKRSRSFAAPVPAMAPVPSTSSQCSDPQWQPIPQYWPQQSFPNVSPWQSQEPAFMTQVQHSSQQPKPTHQYGRPQTLQKYAQQSPQVYQSQPAKQTTPSASPMPSMSPLDDLSSGPLTPGSFNLSAMIHSTPVHSRPVSRQCDDRPS